VSPGRAGRWGRRARHRHHGKRLFWRIFRHGLFLMGLVSLAGALVSLSFGGWWNEMDRVSRYVVQQVSERGNDPVALRRELARVRDMLGVESTVYEADARTVRASSADPPLAPVLSPGETAPRGFPGHSGRALSLPGGRQVVFAFAGRRGHPEHALAALGAILLAIALGSVPLARSIARPVEQLTRAARRLGEGDLGTRVRLCGPGEVGELGRAFDEMAERIEALVRSEKELLANVSHEVRTPLARIRVALELAAEGDLERARRFLAEIGADLDELDHLVEDVLSAARLDLAASGSGAWPLQRARLDPATLLAEVAGQFRERWPGRELVEENGAALPELDGDAGLLRRMLRNLLDNAAKYSEAPAPVALAARPAPQGVLLEIRDRGIGIAAEDLPRLFTPFFRSDRSRARGTGGFGLGLALARRIAAAHGGAIAVESAEGEGTLVRVTLPAAGARA
jgi:signal transduction histidine kinase